MSGDSTEMYQLDIWKGDWGLPSVDVHCLQVLAYAKFCDVPLITNATSNPFRTPRGQLPVLRSDSDAMDTMQDIINFLRKKNYSPDSALSSKQQAEIVSYGYLLKETINPALQFIWWIDHRNFTELIRPWYAKAVPFPLNFYYPSKYEKQARAMMESLFPHEEAMTVIENKVYSDAQKCLTLLSTRLAESEYFFGSQPTSLDALVYAYLAPLLKAPLLSPALQNHLKACTNLVKFVSRISQRYFSFEYQEYEKAKSKGKTEKVPTKDADIDFPNKRRDQVLAGIFAVVAMITYALVTGIVEVTSRDDDEADSEDYMDD